MSAVRSTERIGPVGIPGRPVSAVHSTERIKLVGVLVGTGSAVRSKEQIGQKKTGKDREVQNRSGVWGSQGTGYLIEE